MKKAFKHFSTFLSLVFGIFSQTSPTSMIRFLSFCMFFIATDLTYRLISARTSPLGQYDFYTIIGLYCLAFFPKMVQKVFERPIVPDTNIVPVPDPNHENYQNLKL